MAYTVKQLADLAGVSIRTLHHYDEIGLLTPPVIGANGYRYYDEGSVLRLQSILFYRELDFPLSAIKALLGRPGFDALVALEEQRRALLEKRDRLDALAVTIEKTIQHLKGETAMSTRQLFAGFTPEEEKTYAAEAAKRWNPETVRRAQKKWSGYSRATKEQIKQEADAIYWGLLAGMEKGPSDPTIQKLVADWHRHLGYFWSPNDEQLLGLSALYCEDPAFRKNYDAIDPRLAPFLRDAVKTYVRNREAAG